MAYLSYKMLAEYVILEKLKDEIEITDADKNTVAQFVQAHYLHKFPTGIKKIFAVNHKQQDGSKKMIGMAMYGSPFMTVTKFLEPAGIKLQETLELKRLFIDDVGLRNIESFVIGQTLGKIRKEMPEIRVVITFADDKAGHVGAIYQATNAIYLGKSDDGKHKYIYAMNDDDKKNIEQIIKPQPYPKKEVPPTTEVIKPPRNQAQYDMLAQIKRELGGKEEQPKDFSTVFADKEPEEDDRPSANPPPVLRGANRRRYDKMSKLVNQPPLKETKLSDLDYEQKQDLLAAIKAELEKQGKLQPAEVPEPPIDYPREDPPSHRYADPLEPSKIPAILPSDDIQDPDDEEAALNQKVIDAMKTMPYQDFEKDLFRPQGGSDPEVPNMRLGKMTKYAIKKKPNKSKVKENDAEQTVRRKAQIAASIEQERSDKEKEEEKKRMSAKTKTDIAGRNETSQNSDSYYNYMQNLRAREAQYAWQEWVRKNLGE